MTTEASAPAAQTEVTGTQLITLDPATYVAAVFAPFRERLDAAKAAAAAVTVVDVTTSEGMKTAIMHRAAFRAIRVEAEKARELRKKPILNIGRLLDSRAKDLEAEIEPLEDRFDSAIEAEKKRKEEEKEARDRAEAERFAHIQAGIRDIRGSLLDVAGRSAAAIEEKIRELVALDLTDAQEFKGEAEAARELTLGKLREMRAAQEQAEAQAAQLKADREELDRQRAEQDAEQKRRDDEAASAAREAEARQMAFSEITGIQQQVIIAQIGRLGVRVGGTIACIEETLAETEAWPIETSHFGALAGAAQEAKAAAITSIRALHASAIAAEAEAKRVKEAQDKLDADRKRLADEEEDRQRTARREREDRERAERDAADALARDARLAQERRERQERETVAGELAAVDEIARVEHEAIEARQREADRVRIENADIQDALTSLRQRAEGKAQFAWFVTAYDRNATPKQARRKAPATA